MSDKTVPGSPLVEHNFGFPTDRSLRGIEKREPVISTLCITHEIPFSGVEIDEAVRLVASAILLAFHRMSQGPKLQVCLIEKGERRYLALDFEGVRTLGDLATHISAGSCRSPDHGMVGLLIWSDPGSSDESHLDVGGPLLDLSLEEGRLRLTIRAPVDALSSESATDLLEKTQLIIEGLVGYPELPIKSLELITATSRPLLPDLGLEITPQVYERISHRFSKIAEAHPQETAIEGPLRAHLYSYGQLDFQVKAICREIRHHGIRSEAVCAVAARQSSFGSVAAMLGILQADAVLFMIDLELPEDRVRHLCQLCNPELVITVGEDSGLFKGLPVLPLEAWPSPDTLWEDSPGTSPADGGICSRIDAAYLFFTSGSTGEPKGVLGSHLGLAHFMDWQRSTFPITRGDRHAQLTAPTFDVVLRDILYPLTSGATLVIPSRQWILDPRRILSWFKKRRITSMHCVPSLMKAWLRASRSDARLATLRRIFFAGEPLPSSLLEEVKRRSSAELQIVNLYGPTETTLAKLSKVVTEPEPGIQPVGKPQPGVDAFICRDRQYRCGLWEVGEIAIRTPYRSLGYYNNPDLTALSFLPNPFRREESDLVYYTGDLGRLRPDGVVEIFGRIDYQIKVNGLRIEPVEIEAELIRNPSVVDAAITLRSNQDGEKALWAVMVLVDDYSDHRSLVALQRDLRQQLKLLFPDAMIPRRFHVVDCKHPSFD